MTSSGFVVVSKLDHPSRHQIVISVEVTSMNLPSEIYVAFPIPPGNPSGMHQALIVLENADTYRYIQRKNEKE